MPLHWNKAVLKPAFSAGSYLTEVFEKQTLQKLAPNIKP
jgi:hypothetical protein